MMSQPKLQLLIRQVGPWPMNTYALICPTTRRSVLIDPGADAETLLGMLTGSTPSGILITHTHPDHIGALGELRTRIDAPVLAHAGPHFDNRPLSTDRVLQDGDTITLGEYTIRVYYTPGHIDDQICFALWDEAGQGDHRVIVGDTIFEGGPGKTWSTEGFRITRQTLSDVVLAWPDEAVCYPGHGPSFRLGDKRPDIEAFLAKDHGDFFGDATWDM
jgi:glyoxylase-like metal-dependent hydrolase (beta-lactamase superfamily II)